MNWSAFLKGAGFFGIFPYRRRLTPEEAQQADLKAIAKDWKAVGDDLRTAMEKYDERHKVK